MTWARPPVAAALVDLLTAATGGLVMIHERPPATVNAPAVVVARAETVSYATIAFSIDQVTLPIVIVGGSDQDEAVDSLKATVRAAIEADPTLEGTVQHASPSEERNWRNVNSGGADLLAVDLVLDIQM